MTITDCPKCWDTPCTCGWEYRKYSKEKRLALAAEILGIFQEDLKKIIWNIIPIEHPKNKLDKT